MTRYYPALWLTAWVVGILALARMVTGCTHRELPAHEEAATPSPGVDVYEIPFSPRGVRCFAIMDQVGRPVGGTCLPNIQTGSK